MSLRELMSAPSSSELLWPRLALEVAVLQWPEQHAESDRLESLGFPRLLVVQADMPAPNVESCLEDWIRLPATDEDVRIRLVALSRHASRHPTAPVVDSWGQLSFRGMSVILTPREHAIAEAMSNTFETAVSEEKLIDSAWPDGKGSATGLRVHSARLRKRLGPLGLPIK